MGVLIQRKQFDHPDFAYETARNFDLFDASMPGLVKVEAAAREIDGEYWVYITSEGPLVHHGFT